MPSKGKLTLLSNSGAGDGASFIWPGGRGMMSASATWGGGNIKLQMKVPAASATWADVPSSTLSANGHLFVDLPHGEVRAVQTTATAGYCDLVHIPLM